jgi:hypothetical protein
VGAVTADHIVGPFGPFSLRCVYNHLDAGVVLPKPDHFRPEVDLHAERRRAFLEERLGSRLGNDEDVREPDLGMVEAQSQRPPPHLWPHLGHSQALRDEFVGLAAHVE